MYLITNFMRIFSIAKRINKKITIQKSGDTDKQTTDQASFLTESYSFDLPFFWKLTYIPRYVKYFNSFEASKLPLVQTEKYKYQNEGTLYQETHFPIWVKNGIRSFLVQIGKSLDDQKQCVYVSAADMFQATKNPFYSVSRTTLRETE